MILVTTPTGHIGGQLLKKLMKSDKKIRVIARDPSKLEASVHERCEVMKGSLDHPKDLARAFHGISDLFYVIPPSAVCADIDEYYKSFGRMTVTAVREQKVGRVVFVSGTGLGHEKRAGGVSASFFVEEMFAKSGAHVRILHCGSFMENLSHSMASINNSSSFSLAVSGSSKIPWVATKDIATAAEKLLLDDSWTGVESVGVLGPEDLSYSELAAIMSEVLGKKITFHTMAPEVMKANMMKFGASEAGAQSLVEIYAAMDKGVFNMVKRTPENSYPTTFREWFTEFAQKGDL